MTTPTPDDSWAGATAATGSAYDPVHDPAGGPSTGPSSTAGTAKEEARATAATAKEEAASTAATAKEEARSVADTATTKAAEVAGTAKSEAATVAREAGTQARELAGEFKSQLQEQSTAQRDRLASTLRSVADELRSMADNGGQNGVASELARQAADRSRSFAEFLEGRDPGSLLDELRSLARRKPGTFLLGAALAGVAAGRLTRGAAKANSSDGDAVAGELTTGTAALPAAPTYGVGTAAGAPVAGVTGTAAAPLGDEPLTGLEPPYAGSYGSPAVDPTRPGVGRDV